MGQQLRLELRRPASYRRETFVVSPANEAAVRAVDGWRTWHGGCLALVGPEGVGKTHLAQAWAAQVGAGVLQSADAAPGLDLTRLQGRPVLFEDADQGAPDEILFHLINMAGEAGGGLLLTARTAPSAWPTALPDLRSRLNALPVAELPPPDDAILEGVLNKFFRERNIRPADDLIPYLLRRIERSIPRAQEIVARLDEVADAEHRAVSRALARQILEIEGESRDLFD
ncbi:MAG: DnaA/Hda family protein [Caulobacteraceae bacterium]|nr:DnaA/Hda family protein [Caulobacteraceae bacterium]